MAEQIIQSHQLGTGTRDGAHFLRDDGTWAIPSSGSGGSGSGGGSGAVVPIQSIGPISSAQSTLSFTGIPQTGFRNLRIVFKGRGTASANFEPVLIQFNNDSGANYAYERLDNSTATNSTGQTSGQIGFVTAATGLAASAGAIEISIPGYTDTAFNKQYYSRFHGTTTSATSGLELTHYGGQWASTGSITTISLSLTAGNFDVGSYACLYGEMDTTGVLLTPASNLLYDSGPLASAQANITTGSLSQSYRDLRVVVEARGDTAATQTILQMQVNGDTGNNYSSNLIQVSSILGVLSEVIAGAQWSTADIAAASSISNDPGIITVVIPDYSSTTFNKTFSSAGGVRLTTGTSNTRLMISFGVWASTAAVTSLLLKPTAGNFAAGTIVRVYGEPVSAGGAAVGTGTRVRLSTNQSINTATATPIIWDVEDNDADNQHNPSSANLTGTVSKTALSASLVGSGTLFTTELSIGQLISVPGTAAEIAVVIAIADATHLTVATPFVNTASAQTAARVNTAVTFRQPGFYTHEIGIYSAALSTGTTTLQLRLNGSTIIGQSDRAAINAAAGYDLVVTRQFQQWDYVEVIWTQGSGGSVNVTADERTHWSINARPTIIVAVPYVNVQDQKSSGTAGGTFTSGADQTRTLNAVDSDVAGIATLSANQITLPPGTYRTSIHCPAISVGAHQALLYNVSDAIVIKRGTVMQSGTSDGTGNDSIIQTKFVLSGFKVLEVRHRCTTTKSSDGFGVAGSFGTEVYTIAEFWKEG